MEPSDTAARNQNLPFDLQDGEYVLSTVRRHPVFLWSKLVLELLAALVPAVVLLVIVGITAGLDGALGLIVIAISVLWVAYWLIRAYFTWYRYNHDTWTVTNQRIVDSYKSNWFNHRMSSADLVNVQDLSINKTGILATTFNFGDVRCQTSGTHENFILSGIPNPAKLLSLIDSARDASRREIITRPSL
ncbi:MAG: hypothetical protein ACM3S1_00150 [Hyphomicrobiales bacterium]